MALSKVDLANQVENQLPQNLVANNLPFRNIIINGDMSIAQRGTSTASVSGTTFGACDRWKTILGSLGTFTVSQDTDVPTGQGFAKSFKYDCTTANASPTASAFNAILQLIEGQNLQYLKKGTANAESLTLSFWVKSNKTGTYTCQFRDYDNTRTISQTYTINSANTWEKKTITISGDTTGAFDNDNQGSFQLWFWLGSGSDYNSGTLNTSWNAEVTANRVSSSQVNLADSTSNYINITGVQLEAGTTASDFEFLPYDVNLGRCQRYYYAHTPKSGSNNIIGNAAFYTATSPRSVIQFPVTMRAVPSLSHSTGTDYYGVLVDNQLDTFNDFSVAYGTQNSILLIVSSNVSQTIGYAGYFLTKTNGYIDLDAEL
jgi:hypothetical protein